MMINQLEAVHELYDSIETMLSPDTLSIITGQSIKDVHETPLEEHSGLAGAQISYVDTNAGRYVLKRMSKATDYLMLNSDDTLGRSTTIWEYGLLDELLPDIQHKIIACAREGDVHAILMHDLTGIIHGWENPLNLSQQKIFIDALARIHAHFWESPILQSPQLGLVNQQHHLKMFSPIEHSKLDNRTNSPIPEWILNGWEKLSNLLDAESLEKIIDLRDHPQPLIESIEQFPKTLLHGELRDANVAYIEGEAPILLDWQYAMHGLMTYDFAWFFYGGINDMSQSEAVQYYRDCLENHLGTGFDDTQWQKMVDVGFAIAAMWSIPFESAFYSMNDDPKIKNENKMRALKRAEAILNVMKWF